jgi:hypothetical protein
MSDSQARASFSESVTLYDRLADTISVRSRRHCRSPLPGWPTGWDPRLHDRHPGRAPTLVETGARALLGAAFGSTATSELDWARRLLHLLDKTMLVLMDRGFDAGDFLAGVTGTGAQFLVRLNASRHRRQRLVPLVALTGMPPRPLAHGRDYPIKPPLGAALARSVTSRRTAEHAVGGMSGYSPDAFCVSK